MKLSKYPFIAGVNCLKAIFLHVRRPELKNPPTQEQQLLFQKSKMVGIEGRKIYELGLDISKGGELSGAALVKATKEAMKTREQIFYEAAFEYPETQFTCVCDIFVRSERFIHIIEVKSSTKIKTPQYIYDIGIQYRVLQSHPEFEKMRFYIAHLNKEYVREGIIDYEKLFVLEDVTQRAKDVQVLIDRRLYNFDTVLKKKGPPSIKMGSHCSKPYQCVFYNYCSKEVPENSIQSLALSHRTLKRLESLGVTDTNDISKNSKLTEKQWLEVDAQISKKARINKPKIIEFLKRMNPDRELFFMDFETMMPAIPLFDKTKCYQHIPVQYCVLYRTNSTSALSRREFLSEPGIDPRKDFIENLLRDTEGAGKIVVFNRSFEEGILKGLAEIFPEYKSQVENRIVRLFDLMEPFENRSYYHPSFKGSYSIKVVLPVLCQEHELSYQNLAINSGVISMNKYEALTSMSPREKMETKLNLKEYCHLDVLAMMKIVEALERLTTASNQ